MRIYNVKSKNRIRSQKCYRKPGSLASEFWPEANLFLGMRSENAAKHHSVKIVKNSNSVIGTRVLDVTKKDGYSIFWIGNKNAASPSHYGNPPLWFPWKTNVVSMEYNSISWEYHGQRKTTMWYPWWNSVATEIHNGIGLYHVVSMVGFLWPWGSHRIPWGYHSQHNYPHDIPWKP